MLTLTKDAFARARSFVLRNARALDQALFAYYFENGEPGAVITELAKYQNADGGFGRWLESDFALAASSPAATVTGLEYLGAVHATAKLGTVRRGIGYLLASFDGAQQRWHAVPREVNYAPHAPWWHYRVEEGGCQIDRSLGNPSAEILGHLRAYRELVPTAWLEQLTSLFIERLQALPDHAESFHEILCYVRMVEHLPESKAHARCLDKLRRLVGNATETDPAKWAEYSAGPLFFVTSTDSPFLDLFPAALEAHLDHLIRTQDQDGGWSPNWSWGQYEEVWPEARQRWSGHLTVRNLKLLSNFDRLQD